MHGDLLRVPVVLSLPLGLDGVTNLGLNRWSALELMPSESASFGEVAASFFGFSPVQTHGAKALFVGGL